MRSLPPRPISMGKIKKFDIRWAESLGLKDCPYMKRWVIVLFGYSIRIHYWVKSDDTRFYHSHPWNFFTFILFGSYTDVSFDPATKKTEEEVLNTFNLRYRPANHYHYVKVNKPTLTLVLAGPKIQNWGFWVNNHLMRPLRFFSRYGHPPCSDY